MTEFAPTAEQEIARQMFATGDSLVIEAGAGTGKTATLKLLALDAQAAKRRGQYIAFNKAIVTEAGAKMPPNVACSTAHSLAYRNVIPGTRFGDRLNNSRRMKSMEIADRLELDGMRIVLPDGSAKNLARSYLAGVAMRGITRFCQSADREPDIKHVPFIDGIDLPFGTARSYPNNDLVSKALVPAMQRAWADLTNSEGQLPFKHDHYLKMWQLSGPKINADFVLFDEAQDANPVLLDIVLQQKHAQLVWVGDSQQQIYSFTGAQNALQQVDAEQTAYLTQSFRFGPAIADMANDVLALLPDATLRLTGTATIDSKVEPVDEPDTVLCRTNARAVRYLLDETKAGRRPHIVGGGREVVDFAKGARSLMDTGFTAHPELACFDNWGEVQEYVQQDEQGGDLQLLVKLVDEFGVNVIIDALDNMPSEASADVIVSTAHKSKGREWSTVLIADDFPTEPQGEELRLLYVAVTRAKLVLDITNVGLLSGQFQPLEHEEGTAEPRDAFQSPEARFPAEWDGKPGTTRQLLGAPVATGDDEATPQASAPAEAPEGHGEALVATDDHSGQDGGPQAGALIARFPELTSAQLWDLWDAISEEFLRRDPQSLGHDNNADWHCSCGRKIHGNAAAASHMKAHRRRKQSHRWLNQEVGSGS